MTMRRIALLGLVPLAAALGVATAASGPDGKDGPLACELRAQTANGMTVIEAFAHADRRLDGNYKLSVDGGGAGSKARIRQGGEFAASPGTKESLGRVMLGVGGRYEARLELKAGRLTAACEEFIGGPV
ncbi:hypothetical protein FQ775_02590 [Nitratireductor mangrovi]|uniref:CsgH-like domain-containing protein n=1 Tax=Nitratireductor mangrovi TaxID=2599600 RepID=A0A5B8KUV6_9HYPH|nr:curli-like amyloid fiber formation chaperone CsgH [Nitratireductor mangrovi]QDY99347.1 hypothetical protein FQ775_02590 [Nitratireductor mangrovi]